MSTKKKPAPKKAETVKTAPAVVEKETVTVVEKETAPTVETKSAKETVKPMLYQFFSNTLKSEGPYGFKMPKSKVVIYECYANDTTAAFTGLKKEIKKQLKITSEADVANVLHDMFGDTINISILQPEVRNMSIKAVKTKI